MFRLTAVLSTAFRVIFFLSSRQSEMLELNIKVNTDYIISLG